MKFGISISLLFDSDNFEDASRRAEAIKARIKEDPEVQEVEIESGPDEMLLSADDE